MPQQRTRTLNDATYATDPGQVRLSHEKLRKLRPDLYGLGGFFRSFLERCGIAYPQRVFIEEQLQHGDSRAAVVMSTSPLLIAAYTDELDCIAMLRLPETLTAENGLTIGTRLLTVNTYKSNDRHPQYDSDLILGPQAIKRWTGFHPIIADFVSDDYDRLAFRKQQISETEWQRTEAMGAEYLRLRPGIVRDGRPIYASQPASPSSPLFTKQNSKTF